MASAMPKVLRTLYADAYLVKSAPAGDLSP